MITSLKQNSPWVNICWGIFLPLFVLTILGAISNNWQYIFLPFAPLFLMTISIYLLFTFPKISSYILALYLSFGFSLLFCVLGYYFRSKLWGQAFIIVGFWVWNFVGICGLGLHG